MYATLAIDSPCTLGESILWCERRRVLYWADIIAAQLWRHDPATGDTRHWPLPASLGCLALAEDGRLLLGLAKGLYASDVEAQLDAPQLLLEKLTDVEAGDAHTRINDGRADRHGGFVFGTKSEWPDRRRAGRFYQFTAAHGLRQLALPAAAIPNSICFDASGTRMYFCDSLEPRILHCDYDAATAQVADVRTFVELDAANASPDGAIIDAEGALWNAQWGACRVVRYLPDGSMSAIVQLPTSQPSCCTLQGDTLYISTARDELDPAALAAQPHAGSVFACKLDRVLERGEDRVRLQ
ncbi:SMP-30/gluconolactonase/LRE family protein [Thermomonas sp.]|uniref:SMP-30/gluconolactonase/LRE family protein n=1 Tax=Thermomonas sp. TaxID=1971895 RepID=UPI0039E423DF